MLTRADVERITENVLRNLRIRVINGDFTDPNTRIIKLMYNDIEIDSEQFDIVQKSEYRD